jgi:hypothetical protein
MYHQLNTLLCASTLFVLVSPALFGEEKPMFNSRKIIHNAIQASGGRESLQKLIAYHTRAKGTYYKGKDRAQVMLDYWSNVPNKSRTEVILSVDGQQIKFARVFNEKQAWFLMSDGKWREGTKNEINTLRQEDLESRVRLLYPLLDESKYKLKFAGESKVRGQDSLAVQVTSSGYNDITIYFDKKSGLLLKTQMRVAPRDGEKEALQERLFLDYKSLKGVKYSTKQLLFYDGKKETELELIDINPVEKMPDWVFAKPK